LEHFLYHAAQQFYGFSGERAAELVSQIEIYHPYGSIGPLSWMKKPHAIDFGAEPDGARLLDLAGQIKTFAEGTDPHSSDIDQIRQSLQTASRVVFLGFAYHKQNLELLSPSPMQGPGPRVYGTSFGISRSDVDVVTSMINGMLRPQTAAYPSVKCKELFFEFWRNLSLLHN
jgi:hypothetical protein